MTQEKNIDADVDTGGAVYVIADDNHVLGCGLKVRRSTFEMLEWWKYHCYHGDRIKVRETVAKQVNMGRARPEKTIEAATTDAKRKADNNSGPLAAPEQT